MAKRSKARYFLIHLFGWGFKFNKRRSPFIDWTKVSFLIEDTCECWSFLYKAKIYLLYWPENLILLGQYPNSGEVISENMAWYAEKWGVNVPWRPQAGGVTLAPHFEAWGPYFPIWPRQSQDILIVLGKMWFSQWNLVFQTLAQIFTDIMLQQTSVYIFQCEPMFAWAAISLRFMLYVANIGLHFSMYTDVY